MLRRSALAALVAALLPLALASGPAEAAPVLVTDRAALGGNDSVDWATLGPTGTLVATPFTIASDGGREVEVGKPGGQFRRTEQTTSWDGNFAPGDALLWTWDGPGPISIDFGGPVFGAGAQIQHNQLGLFTARIEAFDINGVSLGSFTVDGASTTAADNSAIFIGILDTEASIARIEFTSETGTFPTFAINRLDFVTAGQPTPAPEPGALLLLGAGLAGLAALRRRTAG